MQERGGGEKAHGGRTHPVSACGGDQRILSEVLQSVLELSPPLRGGGSSDRSQGQAEKNLPVVCDAVGDPAATARPGAVYEAGADRGTDEPKSWTGERHGKRENDAERKTKAVCQLRAKTERMTKTAKQGCGNDGPWKKRKTKGRFPSFPTALGNRKKRDSHIPTAPATAARKSGNPKAGFPLSRRGFPSLAKLKKEDFPERRFPVVQAHRSIRICFSYGWVSIGRLKGVAGARDHQRQWSVLLG